MRNCPFINSGTGERVRRDNDAALDQLTKVTFDGLERDPDGDLALGIDNAALLTNGKELDPCPCGPILFW